MSRLSPRDPSASNWSVGVLAGIVAISLVTVARPRAARTAELVKERSDSYSLPPTQILPQVSLGYRSALADFLWAHVMVTQGLRMRERRPFDYVVQYMDAISVLDPSFRDPYRLADTLVAYQSNDPNKEHNVRQARRLMEQGLKLFPHDPELWLDYGQFLAYVAPSVLTDPTEQEQWRLDGAKALARIADMGTADTNVLHKSVAAVRYMVLNGENEAAIRMLEKAYAITDDPEMRDQIEAKLRYLLGTRQESQRVFVARKFEEAWRNELPFVPRIQVSLVGPHADPWQCAGRRPSELTGNQPCPRDWNTWSSALLPSP